MFLIRKILQLKHRYSNLLGKYEELRQSKGLEEKQKYSDLLRECEQLRSSLALVNGVQTELTKLQPKMERVKTSLEKVEAMKYYCGDKVHI